MPTTIKCFVLPLKITNFVIITTSNFMLSIINQTLDILHANPEWHRRYAGYLADIWANCDKIKKGFVKPQGLSIYTTVGDRKSKNYYLRFKGQNVGKIKVTKDKVILQSLVEESKSHDIKNCPLKYKEETEWLSPQASAFRKFFKTRSVTTRTKSPEHEVENALLREFKKRNGADKALINIQPVLLHDNYFQMPTPLKASTHIPTYAKHNGGGIDMLARIRTNDGHIRLCVIEIKDENIPTESQKIAMSQAITYATFIAQLLKEEPKWMEFFMGHRSEIGRTPSSLDKFDIEVVTIMPEGNTETFENQVLEVPGTKYKLHCHGLYYNKKEFEETHCFDFSGTFLKELRP